MFSDTLSPWRENKVYLITLSDVTIKHERKGWQLLLWSVFFEGTSFYGLSVYGKPDRSIVHKLWPYLPLQCYNQVAKIVKLIFRLFCFLQKEKYVLIRKEKAACENCGNQITRRILSRDKKNYSIETL